MYPYHNRIKQRISAGELVDHYFTDSYPRIGEALVLVFNTSPLFRPIRPHRYAEYVDILADWRRSQMPRVNLTQKQREDAALQRMKDIMIDGLIVNKAKRRMTNAKVGEVVEINDKTIGRIINGGDPQLTITQLLRLMRFAGLKFEEENK